MRPFGSTTRSIARLVNSQLLRSSQSPSFSSFRTMSSSAPSSSSTNPVTPIGDTSCGPITATIISKLQSAFHPSYFAIYNDSQAHAHHSEQRGSPNKVESHFRVELVSDQFEGKATPARHRLVYKVLEEELAMQHGVHALSMKTRTPKEWEKIKSKE